MERIRNETIQSVSVNVVVTYTVTFNANGGAGAPSSQTKTHGTNLTLSSTRPTRTGYTFLGWSTSSGATSATYSAGGTFDLNADTTLYAVWQANTYTITYNANGGSGAPAAQSYTYATSGTINLSSTRPTRSGYTFLGWSLSSTATSPSYSAGQAWSRSNTSNYTLYAVWRANNQTLNLTWLTWATYEYANTPTISQGGSSSMTTVNFTSSINDDYYSIAASFRSSITIDTRGYKYLKIPYSYPQGTAGPIKFAAGLANGTTAPTLWTIINEGTLFTGGSMVTIEETVVNEGSGTATGTLIIDLTNYQGTYYVFTGAGYWRGSRRGTSGVTASWGPMQLTTS